MVNVDRLRGLMAERRITQKELGRLIGRTEATMTQRMDSGRFWTDELEKIAEVLQIENYGEFFFPVSWRDKQTN